jgi:hypothetical protein
MKKRILLSSLFIVLCFSPWIHAQSFEPDQHWRAFKLGLNTSTELPFLNGFKNELRHSPGTSGIFPGLLNPTFAWGKGQNRWWELSVQMLERSHNVDFVETFKRTIIPGQLNTVFYAGISIERVYRSKHSIGKMPIFWSLGLLPQYGLFTFRSDRFAVLDWKADHWRLDYFFGPRILFLQRKHFYMDIQGYFFGGVPFTKTFYEHVNGITPLDNVRKISEAAIIWPLLQMRISAAYRF